MESSGWTKTRITTRRACIESIHHPVRSRGEEGEGEIPELGRAVRAFYIGYVLGTSHEPNRPARLPLHPKEERHGGP